MSLALVQNGRVLDGSGNPWRERANLEKYQFTKGRVGRVLSRLPDAH